MTQRSQSRSRNTVEIFWSCCNTLITWRAPRQQTAPCNNNNNADTNLKNHSMKCTEEKNGKQKAKPQAFTASMKTHIQLQADASATILLTCPLPLVEEFSPLFGFAVKEMGSLPKIIAAEVPLTPAAASIQLEGSSERWTLQSESYGFGISRGDYSVLFSLHRLRSWPVCL